MTLLTWNHTCSVGVKAMDDQHDVLMDTINELRLALVRGVNRERINELRDLLLRFTRLHAWSEEQLMKQSGFSGLGEHRIAHLRLLAHMRESMHRSEHSNNAQLRPLIDSLCNEFIKHTEEMDRQYGTWLNEHGIY
jgi:hemerythrin-like metal-binding protein